jgi:hypothetical protein
MQAKSDNKQKSMTVIFGKRWNRTLARIIAQLKLSLLSSGSLITCTSIASRVSQQGCHQIASEAGHTSTKSSDHRNNHEQHEDSIPLMKKI